METFTERFKRLTADLDNATLMSVTGLSLAGINDLRSGRTKSLKLDAGLRLCRKLKISPWYLQGFEEPALDATLPVSGDGTEARSRTDEFLASVLDQIEDLAKALAILASQRGVPVAARREIESLLEARQARRVG